ncbi:MAG: cytochrome c oxidase subunit 3 [Planctomycetota bacterium]
MSNRWDLMRVSLTRQFYLATLVQAAAVILFGSGLALLFGRQEPASYIRLPWAFAVSTVFLGVGSFYLEKAHAMVRRERQLEFRESLTRALLFAMLFVAVQGYGLWAIDKGTRTAEHAQIGMHGFMFMLTALHAMHFLVAQSVLLWVKLSSAADRYDHEYYWGVTFAKWFWHILGIVWLGILFVFTISFATR